MKNKLSPFLVGLFALGGLALGVAALLSFRSLHLFSKPGRFVAYFNETVQGLDVGSAVKLRGVRLGRVVTIQVEYDATEKHSRVAVIAELDRNVISDRSGKMIPVADRTSFQRLIDDGLRARIDLVGITGLQFVELDFFDPKKFPASPPGLTNENLVVPTLRSGMSELFANFSKIANNLNQVDFGGLTHELQSLFATLNQQVSDVDLKQMAAKVTAAANSIDFLLSSPEAKVTFGNLNKTSSGMQDLVGKLDAQVEPIRAELVQTLHSVQQAARNVERVLGSQGNLGQEAVHALQQVTATAESVQQLADFLERNPSALITGRKRPKKEF